MTCKNGITLLTLGIALTILVILAGAVIINTTGIIEKTETSKFAEEIELIEDKIKEYYIINGKLPIIGGKEYTSNEVINLNSSGDRAKLEQEINKNNDENSTFYLIDYDAIKVKITDRGIGTTTDDIYVVSKDTNTVYYLQGIKIGKDVYFSLAYISDVTKVD